MSIEVLGFVAGTLTTFAFVPQVARTIKTNDTSGISVAFSFAFNAGVILWLIYGIMVDNVIIIASNTVVLFLSLVIFTYKIRNVIFKKESL